MFEDNLQHFVIVVVEVLQPKGGCEVESTNNVFIDFRIFDSCNNNTILLAGPVQIHTCQT